MTAALVPPPAQVVPEVSDAQRERLAAALTALSTSLESPHSRRAYREDWARFTAFLALRGVHPLHAGPMDVAAYLDLMRARGLARATCARALSIIREVCAALYRAGLCHANPAREVKLPRVRSEPRTPWLTVAELVALLRPSGDGWVDRRDRLVLLMLVGLALRRSSVAGARVQDLVQRTDGRLGLRVRAKGGRVAEVLLPLWLAAEIQKWIEFSGVTTVLFPRVRRIGYADGADLRPEMERSIGPGKVWDVVKAAARRTGVDETRAAPHAVRRSFVTIARERGVAIEDLQSALLHDKVETTQLYDRAVRSMKSAPGEALRDLYEAACTDEDRESR